jgi:hypothetical protein
MKRSVSGRRSGLLEGYGIISVMPDAASVSWRKTATVRPSCAVHVPARAASSPPLVTQSWCQTCFSYEFGPFIMTNAFANFMPPGTSARTADINLCGTLYMEMRNLSNLVKEAYSVASFRALSDTQYNRRCWCISHSKVWRYTADSVWLKTDCTTLYPGASFIILQLLIKAL